MAKRRRGLGARLSRLMVRLGTRREQRGKETSEDAGAQDRPWGGQSCPDLAQGSTSNLSLKAQTQSHSEWDLRTGSHGSWLWKRRHISEETSQVLGRLQRPAVGSASDLAMHASLEPEALPVASAESSCTQSPSLPMPPPDSLEQEPLGCTCLQTPSTEVPLRPEAPSNVEAVLLLPRPVSFPTAEAEGTKGERVTLGPALSEPAQTLQARPFTRRTRYHITVTLQECGPAPREEGEEPEPAQPDPRPCGPEESMGWQEPPQGPRPISGCPTNPAQDSRLKAGLHQGSTAQRQELLTGRTPESLHRRELAHRETRTPQDRSLGPSMEEAGGPQARAEARVVSATLTWRQRPPAQEESRHRFHKMSLVSGSQMEAPQEETLEYNHRQEEVNGFTTREEETVTYQGPRDGAGVKNFQSHGPIFSKKYTPPPKEKRPVGRPKEAVDQGDSSPQPPRMEPPGLGTMARTELLVPLPGPREPSPHPCMGLSSEGPWIQEERRVTRTVRTTTVVAGQVDRRVKSSVTMNPVLSAEALSRGRNTVRKIRAVVVNPRAEGSPSRSQALELLTSLVPTEHSPPASRLPRPTVIVSRSPGLGATGGAVLGRLPETEAAEPKSRSNVGPVGIPEGAHLPQYQHVPATHPNQDQSRDLDARTHEGFRVHGASSPTQLSLQSPQDPVPRPFCPRIEIHPPPLDPEQSPKQPVLPTHPRTQQHLKSMVPPDLPSLKKDLLPDPPSVPVVSEQIVTSVSVNRKTTPSPGCLPVPFSPSKRVVQDSEDTSVFSFTPKDLAQEGPIACTDPPLIQKEAMPSPDALAASPTKSTKVVQDPEASPNSASTQKEAVQSADSSLAPFLTKEQVIQNLPDPATQPPKQEKVISDPAASPLTSPTQNEAQDSASSSALLSTEEVAVQGPAVLGPAVLPTSPSAVKVSPSPEGPSASVPLGAEDTLQSQLVPDSSKDKMPSEPSRDEDEVALTADLEIFLDTLRSMEPPEILRTHRLPRAPRSSYLAMYATLPAIEEDHPGPWVLEPRPQEVPALEEEEKEGNEEEEEEELENPYLSDDEKLQHQQEKAKEKAGPSWDPLPTKPPQDFRSPLEMMKKHIADTKGSHPELGLEGQLGSRLTSRLGGSLLFSGLMSTSKETPTLEPLGTKLSALPPHRVPGLKKVPGQLPLLCSEKPAPERPSRAQHPEGWSPALKIQGKLNTRPGKIILFSEPSCQGRSREVWEDTADTLDWGLVASVRVVRGSWVLYEEPEFQGRKLVLLEGDVELQGPGKMWSSQGIGSLRKAVQHYSTPEINLFSEEDLKGEQLKLTQALEDPQSLGRPLQVASITVSAGLWLLYSKPFFEDTPCILEPGNYHNLEACGISDRTVGSLKPVTLGCPSVERPGEPKAVVYEAPDFQGRSWEVSRDIYNLQQPEDSQSPNLASVGSLRVLGGCWVGYEKEGFRGHQYLLEEGEYADWSHWGGYDEVLTSLRVIRTDFGDPALVLFEAMDFEGPGVEVSEALPDVELAGHGPCTQAISVLSGVWVAYQGVGFSGEQYVLEKGVYRNCDDWGSGSSALTSLQPVLQVGEHNLHFVSKIQLFSSPNFLGDHISFEDDQASLPLSFQPQSCRVHGGSWILFDEKNFEGDQHILSEGEFPTLTAMGCLASTVLGSLQKVPLHFSEPSIFLYGLECFEGKEIELKGEVRSLQAEGFNNHVLSVRIKGGIWVLCEHSDFRGRQWLVGSCEITNWLTYSGTQRVGSLYPIKQRRAYFRLWNAALGGFLAVPDHVEDMKAGRVVVSDPRSGSSCVWYYEDGLLKNQVAPTMSLQVIGSPSKGSKVVLWAESRLPRQTWSIKESGHICSQMFEDRILDVKGGRGYDRDHVVLWELAKDRPSQIWTIHVL